MPTPIDYRARLTAEHDAGLLDADDLAAAERLLAGTPAELVGAHGDPLPANLLFDGASWGLVDWEHASRYLPVLQGLSPAPAVFAQFNG